MSISGTRPIKMPDPAVQPPARRSGDVADSQWRERAACRSADPDLFVLDLDDPGTALALSYCGRGTARQCPVMEDCRAFAWENGAQGVWGGTWRPVYNTIRSYRVSRRPED